MGIDHMLLIPVYIHGYGPLRSNLRCYPLDHRSLICWGNVFKIFIFIGIIVLVNFSYCLVKHIADANTITSLLDPF